MRSEQGLRAAIKLRSQRTQIPLPSRLTTSNFLGLRSQCHAQTLASAPWFHPHFISQRQRSALGVRVLEPTITGFSVQIDNNFFGHWLTSARTRAGSFSNTALTFTRDDQLFVDVTFLPCQWQIGSLHCRFHNLAVFAMCINTVHSQLENMFSSAHFNQNTLRKHMLDYVKVPGNVQRYSCNLLLLRQPTTFRIAPLVHIAFSTDPFCAWPNIHFWLHLVQYDAMAAARHACMTLCIAEVYGVLHEPTLLQR